MGIYDRDDSDLVADLNAPGKCSFCGAPAASFWCGSEQTVFTCAQCACTTLAQLAADAAVGSARKGADVSAHAGRMLDRLKAEFWRAVCLAAARKSGRATG